MGLVTFTNVTLLVFSIYLAVVGKNFYDMFFPEVCNLKQNGVQCIKPIANWESNFKISICVSSLKRVPSVNSQCSQLIQFDNKLNESLTRELELSVPSETRKNGSLYLHVVVHQSRKSSDNLFSKQSHPIKTIEISKYRILNAKKFVNLLENLNSGNESDEKSNKKETQPVTHLLSQLRFSIMHNNIVFNIKQVPGEIISEIMLNDKYEYMPVVFVNRLAIKDEHYSPLNETNSGRFNITIEYSPMSIGLIRFFRQFEESLEAFKEYGISETQVDELKGIFTDTNLYLILLTFLVSLLHLLFEFLAFKNDISFWRKRKNNVGLSVKTLLWRLFSQLVIFVYLLQEETSLLILVPSGISILIELWKVAKAFKIKIIFNSYLPTIQLGENTKEEEECMSYDSMAMKKLSYVLWPLCVVGAVYSLIYNTHKSWYSWFINSLVNGIYAFGFLFMTPQLFMNYKLKSVAHLPWKAFMYKAFNTFIDDVFAFIIKMPTMHRLACLRDDLVFLVYLYQRWLYPIDTKRTNEYGQSFDADNEDEGKQDSKKTN